MGIVVILSAHFFSFIFLSSNNCVDVNKTTRGSFSNNFSMSFLESTCQPRCYTLKHTLLLQCCYLNCIFVALILFTLLFFSVRLTMRDMSSFRLSKAALLYATTSEDNENENTLRAKVITIIRN